MVEIRVIALSSLTGALIIPLIVYLGHEVKYVGGAIASIPIVDLLPLLFISNVDAASSQLLGDVGGQAGALFAIFGCYYTIHWTKWGRNNKNATIVLFLLSALVLNLLVWRILAALNI